MKFKMMLVESLAWSVAGVALSGALFGQSVDVSGGINAAAGDVNATANAAANGVADTVQNGVNAGAAAVEQNANAALNQTDANVRANGNVSGNGINNSVNRIGVNAGAAARTNNQGVRIGVNSAANRDRLGLTFSQQGTTGLVIDQTRPNSLAARAGLQSGDRIVSINGQAYQNANDFNAQVDQFQNLRTVPIVYERNGQQFTRDVDFSQDVYGTSDGDQSYSANRPNYGTPGEIQQIGYSQSVGAGCGEPVAECCGGSVMHYSNHDGHHSRHYDRQMRRTHRRYWR